MISVCCCAINAKYDVDCFVRSLHQHNPESHFEIFMVHDDRVEDGGQEFYLNLAAEYPSFKSIRRTHQDSVDYLHACIRWYEQQSKFTPEFRELLRSNLNQYTNHNLFDTAANFLWLSSGHLYNKAVQQSTGDILIITPGDFVYMFPLDSLEEFVNRNARDGHFYASPNAIFARITNLDYGWMERHVQEVHDGTGHIPEHRWDCVEPFRDYFSCPTVLHDWLLPDYYHGQVMRFTEPRAIEHMMQFCKDGSTGGVQYIPAFHGFHVMTRKTFDAIGGFSEEWFGRAWADDRMTQLGKTMCSWSQSMLPPEISVGWVGQSEILHGRGPGYPPDMWEKLAAKDPYYGKHPIPQTNPVFLHGMPQHEITPVVQNELDLCCNPIRLT